MKKKYLLVFAIAALACSVIGGRASAYVVEEFEKGICPNEMKGQASVIDNTTNSHTVICSNIQQESERCTETGGSLHNNQCVWSNLMTASENAASGGNGGNGGSNSTSSLTPVSETDAKSACYSMRGTFQYSKCVNVDNGGIMTAPNICGESHGRWDQNAKTCTWNITKSSGQDSSNKNSSSDNKSSSDSSSSSSSSSGATVNTEVNSGDCTSILPSSWCGDGGIKNMVLLIKDILTGLIVVAGTIGIIVCGVMWMTARDNETQVATAKRRIFEIAIGIVAWVLLSVLIGLLIPNNNSDISVNNSDISSKEDQLS